MKVTLIDLNRKLRKHCIDLEDGARVGQIKTVLVKMSLVPPGFCPKLVYQTKLLADNDSLSSIGYDAGRGISFLCVRCPVAEASPAAVDPTLPVISVKLNPIDIFGAQPDPLDKHATMRAFISSCIAETRVQEANPNYCDSLHLSDDSVEFFDSLMERICKSICRHIDSVCNFETAVRRALPSNLADYYLKDPFVEARRTVQDTAAMRAHVSAWLSFPMDPALSQTFVTKIIGLIDYVMHQFLDQFWISIDLDLCYHKRVGHTDLCIADAFLLKSKCKEGSCGSGVAEAATESDVKILLQQRYQPCPSLLIYYMILSDNDILELCESLWGVEFEQCFPPRKYKDEMLKDWLGRCMQLWKKDDPRMSWFCNGVGAHSCAIPSLGGSTFPRRCDLSTLLFFCLQYDAVDALGFRQKDGAEDCYIKPLAKMLDAIRRAHAGECIQLDLTEMLDEELQGCAVLQLFGALIVQVTAGNVSKVSCRIPSYAEYDEKQLALYEQIISWIEELLGDDVLDHDCLPLLNTKQIPRAQTFNRNVGQTEPAASPLSVGSAYSGPEYSVGDVPASASMCSSKPLQQGSRVRIEGLQSKPEINGREGIICEACNQQNGRWTVRIDADGINPSYKISVCPANLQVIRLERAFVPSAVPASHNFATQWMDEDGLVFPTNVDSARECPKGHKLADFGSCAWGGGIRQLTCCTGGTRPGIGKGSRVIIEGLKSSPEMNGRTGVICGEISPQNARFTVNIDADGARHSVLGTFSPANLRVIKHNPSVEWLDENGLICPKNVDFSRECPKGHVLVPFGADGLSCSPQTLMCRVCHIVAAGNSGAWLVCSIPGCCGWHAVCASCALARATPSFALSASDNFCMQVFRNCATRTIVFLQNSL